MHTTDQDADGEFRENGAKLLLGHLPTAYADMTTSAFVRASVEVPEALVSSNTLAEKTGTLSIKNKDSNGNAMMSKLGFDFDSGKGLGADGKSILEPIGVKKMGDGNPGLECRKLKRVQESESLPKRAPKSNPSSTPRGGSASAMHLLRPKAAANSRPTGGGFLVPYTIKYHKCLKKEKK